MLTKPEGLKNKINLMLKLDKTMILYDFMEIFPFKC